MAGMHRGDDIGQAESFQARNPVGPDAERHQRRPGIDDRMAEPPRDRIAVAGGAAARIRRPPTAMITRRAVTVESGSSTLKRGISARLRHRSARSRAPGSDSAGSLPIARAAARGHRARRWRGPRPGRSCRCLRSWSRRRRPRTTAPSRRHPTAATPAQGTLRYRRRPAGSPGCPRLRAVVNRVDRAGHDVEPAQAAGIGDIAARAAGHQDLDAGPPVLFDEDHARAAFRGSGGGHQSRAPAPGRPRQIRNRMVETTLDRRKQTPGEHASTQFTGSTDYHDGSSPHSGLPSASLRITEVARSAFDRPRVRPSYVAVK